MPRPLGARRIVAASRLSFDPAAALAVRAAVLGQSGPPRPESGVLAATEEIDDAPLVERAARRGGGGTHSNQARDR